MKNDGDCTKENYPSLDDQVDAWDNLGF